MRFAVPIVLFLLLLLPILAGRAIFVQRKQRKQWALFAAERLRPFLLRRGSSLAAWISLAAMFFACAALILAMARPQVESGTETEKTRGRNILIALDLSRSMLVSDVKPSRLAQAKITIFELLDALPNDRVGLLGFAGNPYIYAPLTIDHPAIRETVEQIDESWAPVGGSDFSAALELAIQTLEKTGQKNNALVILSDGEKHSGNLDSLLSRAKHAGVFILSIGVGTEDGGFVPNPRSHDGKMHDRSGKPVLSRLQPEILRSLATETNGRYAVAGSSVDIPALIQSVVKDLDTFEMAGRQRKLWMELYQWFLLPGILLLIAGILLGTRWRSLNFNGERRHPGGSKSVPLAALNMRPEAGEFSKKRQDPGASHLPSSPAILLLGFFLIPTFSRADAISDAKSDLSQKHYAQAKKAYHSLAESAFFSSQKALFSLGEATAAYRAADFLAAREAFSKALLSKKSEILSQGHLGLGNSLFQIGWQTLSGEPYPAQPPPMETFDAYVKKLLAQSRKSFPPPPPGPPGTTSELPANHPLKALIVNWTDSIRHFDSALSKDSKLSSAKSNRAMVRAYLERLRKLLEEDKQQTEQSIPQSQPDQKNNDQGKNDEKNQDKDKSPKDQPNKDPNGDKPKDSPNNAPKDQPKPDDQNQGKQQQQDSDKSSGEKPKPETPEEHAGRMLKENADLETGPPVSRQRKLFRPEKDW